VPIKASSTKSATTMIRTEPLREVGSRQSAVGSGQSSELPTADCPLPTSLGPVSGYRRRPGALLEENSRDLASLTQQLTSMEEIVVSDVLLTTDQGRITIFDLPDRVGNCSRVFKAVAAAGIGVDMIVQNLSAPGKAHLSFSVPLDDLARAQQLTEKAVRPINPSARVVADGEIAKLIVLGVGMRTHTGVARRMFGALAERGINIAMINTSEVRVGVVVARSHGTEALACLKAAFDVR